MDWADLKDLISWTRDSGGDDLGLVGGFNPHIWKIWYTPSKINMEPENDGLEDDFPFQLGDF